MYKLDYPLKDNKYYIPEFIIPDYLKERTEILKYWLLQIMSRKENHIIPEYSLDCDIAQFLCLQYLMSFSDTVREAIFDYINKVEYLPCSSEERNIFYKNFMTPIQRMRISALNALIKEGKVEKFVEYGFDVFGYYGKINYYKLNLTAVPSQSVVGENEVTEW